MSHLLEWSRAYAHRLNPVDAAPLAARAPELARRLAVETPPGGCLF
jgi:glucose-6-phosphate isomerase